jgi:hypothetical protein
MRGIESLMMALALGVVGVGLWAVHKWIPQSGLNIFRPTSSEPAKLPSPTVAKAERPVRKHTALPTHNLTLPLGVIEVEVPTGFPFPTPADLPAGTTRAQIMAKYGEPTARVSGIDEGRVFERYYFLHRDRKRITIATLRNGVVARAESAVNQDARVGQP